MSQPLSGWAFSGAAACAAAILVGYLFFGSYTKRVTVSGRVVPSDGVTKVYAPQSGLIVDGRLTEGQTVKRGDKLFVLSSERTTGSLENVQATNIIASRSQIDRLRTDIQHLSMLRDKESDGLQATIASLDMEAPNLQQRLERQRLRVSMEEQSLERYEGLLRKGFITQDQYLQKQGAVLDQRERTDSLARELISLRRQRDDTARQMAALPLKFAAQISELERTMNSMEQSILENEGRREFAVIAPESGSITAITIHPGQRVDPSTPLASIVPTTGTLIGELYAPSRAVGFVQPGSVVQIAFDAYPFQKFGLYKAVVVSISTTALSSIELTQSNLFETGAARQGGEPLYKIVVAFAAQTISAYGQPMPLRAGLLLQAHILQERRTLIEWALEPLYSLRRAQ